MSQSNETSGDRAYPKQKVLTADGEPQGETPVRRVRCHTLALHTGHVRGNYSTNSLAEHEGKDAVRTHGLHRELYPTVVPSFPSGSDKVFLFCF